MYEKDAKLYIDSPTGLWFAIRHISIEALRKTCEKGGFSPIFHGALVNFYCIANQKLGGESTYNSTPFRIHHFLVWSIAKYLIALEVLMEFAKMTSVLARSTPCRRRVAPGDAIGFFVCRFINSAWQGNVAWGGWVFDFRPNKNMVSELQVISLL